MTRQVLQPGGWKRPSGYANGIAATGRLVFTAGVIGWDGNEHIVAPDMAGQARQIFENIRAILAEAGAGPEHIVRLTWYITSRDEYHASLATIGAHYRAVFGRLFPTMAVVQVAALMEPAARIEIEATAVVPEAGGAS